MKSTHKWRFPTVEELLSHGVPDWECHVHSDYSDGKSDLTAIVERALQIGLTHVAVTEHTETDLTAGPGWFARYCDEMSHLKRVCAGRLQLGVGVEVPAADYDGGLDWGESQPEACDFILGAVHVFPDVGWLYDMGLELDPYRVIELEYRALMGLARNPQLDAIAHPGGLSNRYRKPFPDALLDEVIAEAARHEIALEWNPAYHDDAERFLLMCAKHDARVAPGSNAHAPKGMGGARAGLRQAREALLASVDSPLR
ncbi:PHP domain-containing protein [Magnetofaba australis]|uniref:Putative phosphotransferase domain-containing protein n=1 Tax=Magnetofaba australis IT-1 TaxID=1434232 RepID=A0A1Y2K4T3_9PROT|nr:PHP domain-containing protein [Magnetofaba australis]OSM04269.1 putative phosphotransferase domain-containing protein [Magnetofaba australis IT-1]